MRKNRKGYDLIHTFFGIPCGFLAMLTGKPYIVSLRGSDVPFYSKKYEKLDRYIFQHLSKLIWKRAKYVVANSEGLRDLAYETYDKKDIGVIYNGVDTDMFKPKEKKDGFVVVSTSRLIERKGLDFLIEAFGKFQGGKDDASLIFYGDGSQRDELENMVKELGIQDKVEFLGEASREDIARNIPKYHVFVLPSKNEGMSNSLLEAMASGLAVIATDVGGTKELVDNSNGIIVDKESVEDIYNSLEKLYSNRGLLERMGRESRKKAESMSCERMAREYVKLYRNINNTR
jgi:glycosyltransferase involved in cell wall biosynthesis